MSEPELTSPMDVCMPGSLVFWSEHRHFPRSPEAPPLNLIPKYVFLMWKPSYECDMSWASSDWWLQTTVMIWSILMVVLTTADTHTHTNNKRKYNVYPASRPFIYIEIENLFIFIDSERTWAKVMSSGLYFNRNCHMYRTMENHIEYCIHIRLAHKQFLFKNVLSKLSRFVFNKELDHPVPSCSIRSE